MTTQEDRRFGGDHHSWKPLTICLATKASTGKFTHKSRHTDGLVAGEQHASVSKPFRQEGRRQWHPCNFARVETGKFIDPTYVYTPPASNHYCFLVHGDSAAKPAAFCGVGHRRHRRDWLAVDGTAGFFLVGNMDGAVVVAVRRRPSVWFVPTTTRGCGFCCFRNIMSLARFEYLIMSMATG
jgi:hypothetical protein